MTTRVHRIYNQKHKKKKKKIILNLNCLKKKLKKKENFIQRIYGAYIIGWPILILKSFSFLISIPICFPTFRVRS